jgi:ABC-type sugar transport system substrate-binding protein
MVSASVAVWVREPDVPVNVIVGVADGVAMGAVNVVVAEGCAGVRVRVDGLAVTPEGRPEMETETEPLKELIALAVTVMALLVVPALRVSEPGETAREKSGGAA